MSAPYYGYTSPDDPCPRDCAEWAFPTPALHVGGPVDGSVPTLSKEQIKQWHDRRFVVVDDIWPAHVIGAAAAQWRSVYPVPSMPRGAEELRAAQSEAGAIGPFPWADELLSCNLIPVHTRILQAVAQLLGTAEIILTQSRSI